MDDPLGSCPGSGGGRRASPPMDTALAGTIGRAARAARRAHGWTQQDAAERAGVSLEFYARIESGVTLPSAPTLVRLAETLGVAVDALVGRGGADLPLVARERASEPHRPPVLQPLRADTEEAPSLRRCFRKLRSARPSTVRLVTQLVRALERRP